MHNFCLSKIFSEFIFFCPDSLHVVTWNEIHHRMTSSDRSGLIIVWMLYNVSYDQPSIIDRWYIHRVVLL